jgi:hypothetical protein
MRPRCEVAVVSKWSKPTTSLISLTTTTGHSLRVRIPVPTPVSCGSGGEVGRGKTSGAATGHQGASPKQQSSGLRHVAPLPPIRSSADRSMLLTPAETHPDELHGLLLHATSTMRVCPSSARVQRALHLCRSCGGFGRGRSSRASTLTRTARPTRRQTCPCSHARRTSGLHSAWPAWSITRSSSSVPPTPRSRNSPRSSRLQSR